MPINVSEQKIEKIQQKNLQILQAWLHYNFFMYVWKVDFQIWKQGLKNGQQ